MHGDTRLKRQIKYGSDKKIEKLLDIVRLPTYNHSANCEFLNNLIPSA
jgi:hypothetical protein